MNSSQQGINIHCPNCGFSFELIDLNLPVYNCPSCDFEIVMRAKGDTSKTPPTQTFVGTIEEKPALKPGSELGGFELISEIGRGGMGVVYKALQKSLNREVALKILPEHLSNDPEFIKRFQREAQALATLTHPNVVSILDRCEADDVYFFVMEYVNGKSLRQIMRNRRLHLVQILSIVSDICNGLSYAHSRGIIHRDVKPENILIDTNGIVKITDFGLSRILRKDSEFSRITNTAITMGTLDYMSPEQRISSKSADHRSDIYAVGVVMYELLTNEIPVGNFEKPSTLEPSLPPIIDEIVMKALKSNSVDRFQTVAQMKEQVDKLMEDVKKLQNYNNSPNYTIPKARPINDYRAYNAAMPPYTWQHQHERKKKGFFKTIMSYEFLIIGLIVGIFALPFLIPILGFLLIIRIFVGDVFNKSDDDKQTKAYTTSVNSEIRTEFTTDPVAAGSNKKTKTLHDHFEQEFMDDDAKGFFKDMKKQFKQKYKEVKKQIQADLKQYVRSENTMSKDEIESEIDKRVQFEVERRMNFEIERMRQEEKAKEYRFGILTVISMLLFIGAGLGIILIGGYIFAKEFLQTWLYTLDLDYMQNLMEWKKFAGVALFISMFIFSAISAGACKRLRRYGRSMALLAMFFTLMSIFFWYHEWKNVNEDIQYFQNIENNAQTNPKESAKHLKEIVYEPENFNSAPNAIRFLAIKSLFDTDVPEYEAIRNELKSSSNADIRKAWIQAAKLTQTKVSLTSIESLLKDNFDEVVKSTLAFIMDKYPDKGWATIQDNYDQLSYENKKWLIDEVGRRKPTEMLSWLQGIQNSKLEPEVFDALSEYRTLSSLPYFAEQLFSENRKYRQNAFQALKDFPKETVYGIFIKYVKDGKDVELRDQIVDFLEDNSDFDGDEDNPEEWESWLTKRHKKIYDQFDESMQTVSNLLSNVGGLSFVESQTNKKNNEVLTNPEQLYNVVCLCLLEVYGLKSYMIYSLAPEEYENKDFKFENSIELEDFMLTLENIKKKLEFRYPDLASNAESETIRQDCERKQVSFERKLRESFDEK